MALSKAIEFPGNVNLVGNITGSFPGCKVAFIKGEGEELANNLNAYFSANDNLNASYIREVVVPGGLLIFWTKALSNEEIEVFDQFNSEVEQKMRLWKDKRDAAKREEEEKQLAIEKEKARLVALGLQCEKNHPKEKKAKK